MNPDSAKLMSINSDFPLDKVVYLHTRTVNVSGGGFNDQIFPHGLPFTPLVLAQWSFDSNFATAYDVNGGPRFSPGGTLLFQSILYSDSTNITIFNNNNQGSPITVYWRIYGFMPSTVSEEAGWTASAADDFVVNTEYNYSKLYMSGVTGFSGTSGSTVTVNHGLGYRPQVLVWSENSTQTSWIGSFTSEPTSGNTRCRVDDENIVLIRDSGALPSPLRFHYRVYIDE